MPSAEDAYLFRYALESARKAGDRRIEDIALSGLALLHAQAECAAQSRQPLEQAVQRTLQPGDPKLQVHSTCEFPLEVPHPGQLVTNF